VAIVIIQAGKGVAGAMVARDSWNLLRVREVEQIRLGGSDLGYERREVKDNARFLGFIFRLRNQKEKIFIEMSGL
jgi:hypothetical protein